MTTDHNHRHIWCREIQNIMIPSQSNAQRQYKYLNKLTEGT